MLSETMVDKLNQQIQREIYSSNLYLQMSSWCYYKGLEGCAAFLRKHAEEELDHMQRLFSYVNETGAMAVLGEIEAPPSEFDSVENVFKKTLEHERFITEHINDLTDTALEEKDYSTFNFLQWYVAEQHEEERLFNTILDKIKIIGTEGRGIFHIDREVGRMAGSES
jgi:ferritin